MTFVLYEPRFLDVFAQQLEQVFLSEPEALGRELGAPSRDIGLDATVSLRED